MAEGSPFHRKHLFRTLSREELAFVRSLGLGTASVAPNRDLVSAGEVGGHVFMLVEGWAFGYVRVGERGRQILRFLLPGDVAALQSGLRGIIDHSVRALTHARFDVIDGRRLDELFAAHPRVGLGMAKLLAQEERRADRRLAMLGRGTALQRISFLFLEIFTDCAERGLARGDACPFPLHRQHIADFTGLTGAHVNRTMRVLRETGLALVQKDSLTLPDRAMLLRLVEGETPPSSASAPEPG
jgi:CRP/FNR family transcriptional regulator, anaerobic regulatory protein